MKTAVDHIARSVLPWRPEESGLTECGLVAASFPTITREAYQARLMDLGQQRAALFTCWTCSDTVNRWRTWGENPVSAMQRETAKYSPYRSPGDYEDFRKELVAIAALIAAHREEFDAYIAGLGAVVNLDERRKHPKKKIARPVRL